MSRLAKMLSGALATIIRYVAWAGLCFLALWALLELRINLFDIMVQVHVDKYAIPFLTNAFITVAILFWLGACIYLESYLVNPPDFRVFVRRALRLAAICGGTLVFSYALQAVL
jgi:hypothetical protein